MNRAAPIIAIYYSPLTTLGGAERQWAQELLTYGEFGVPVMGITHTSAPRLLEELGLNGERVVSLPGGGLLARIRSLRAWLKQHSPQLLVAHTSPELVYLATRGLGLPYVLYQNSPIFYQDFSRNPYPHALQHRAIVRRLGSTRPGFIEFAGRPKIGALPRIALEARAYVKSRAMRSAADVIVVSRRTAEEVEGTYGVPATVVRGCLDPQLASRRQQLDIRLLHRLGTSRVALSVSRLEEVKRVDLLLRAFAEPALAGSDVRLLVVGTGAEEARLKALSADLGLHERAVFAGYVPEADLWHYYRSADVLVAPATADFILTPYEALALGTKVVISEDLEFEDWLLDSGWVFPSPATPAGLAAAIQSALAAPPRPAPDLTPLTTQSRVANLLACFARLPGVETLPIGRDGVLPAQGSRGGTDR